MRGSHILAQQRDSVVCRTVDWAKFKSLQVELKGFKPDKKYLKSRKTMQRSLSASDEQSRTSRAFTHKSCKVCIVVEL